MSMVVDQVSANPVAADEVFAAFSVLYLKQAITWNHVIGFALIASGAFFVFRAPV